MLNISCILMELRWWWFKHTWGHVYIKYTFVYFTCLKNDNQVIMICILISSNFIITCISLIRLPYLTCGLIAGKQDGPSLIIERSTRAAQIAENVKVITFWPINIVKQLLGYCLVVEGGLIKSSPFMSWIHTTSQMAENGLFISFADKFVHNK